MLLRLQKVRNSNIWQWIQGMVVSFAICIAFGLTTSNVLYLLVGGLYLAVNRQRVSLEKKENLVNIILSTLFSIFVVLGNIENVLDVDFLLAWPVTVIICFWGFYLCFELLLSYFLYCLRNASVVNEDVEYSKKRAWVGFGVSLLALLIVWGIGFAFSYPGNTTRDSNTMLSMALGKMNLKAAIPTVYVLILNALWNFGFSLFGTPNAAFAVCSGAHVIFVALIVAYLISRLYAYNVKRHICVIIWAFYAFVPYNVQLAHTVWKDIPFSACVFLFMILIWEDFFDRQQKFDLRELCRLFGIIIAGIGMCLMRNNGYFAYLLFLPFAVYMFYKNNKKVLVSLGIIFVLIKVIQGPVNDEIMTRHKIWVNELKAEEEGIELSQDKAVKKVKNATSSYNASGIYIITVQQLGRVAVDRFDLSAEDYLRLNNVIDVERMREEYDPYCRDSAGYLINYKLPVKEYIKEWIYFGVKYPIQYMLAWKDQTFGYWYPDIQYWVYTDQIKENELGLYKDSILSDDQRYELMLTEEMYKEIPIYGMVWSIGFVVWMTLFFAGVTYIRKGLKAVMLYVPVLGVWATLLVATPVYAEFRYIYAMFLCLPLSVMLPFISEKKC